MDSTMYMRRCDRCDSPLTYDAETCHRCGNRKPAVLIKKEILPTAVKVLIYPFLALLFFLFLGPAIFNFLF